MSNMEKEVEVSPSIPPGSPAKDGPVVGLRRSTGSGWAVVMVDLLWLLRDVVSVGYMHVNPFNAQLLHVGFCSPHLIFRFLQL